jgi:hypothetical protein
MVAMIQETELAATGDYDSAAMPDRAFFWRTEIDLPRFRAAERAEQGFQTEPATSPRSIAWWERLERGLMQRFQALHLFMERLASGKSLPRAFEAATNSVFRDKLRKLAPAISLAPGLRGRSLQSATATPWTWLGASDLLLLPDGSTRVLDHDFSALSGLERLPELLGLSQADAASTIRAALFPQGCDRSGEPSLLLEPAHPAADQSPNDFLARCLAAERVHRGQLQAGDGGLYLLRNGRPQRVRSLIRRIDDQLLDPNFFRPDSLVGLPGLVRSWSTGETNLLHAPGSSLLQLRTVVRHVPQMIREYLGQTPLLETAGLLECDVAADWELIQRNPRDFVFRRCDPMEPIRPCSGRSASTSELSNLLSRIRQNPCGWCARPIVAGNQGGRSLRVFASSTDRFRLLRAGIVQPGQPDGGAPLLIPAECCLTLLQPGQ